MARGVTAGAVNPGAELSHQPLSNGLAVFKSFVPVITERALSLTAGGDSCVAVCPRSPGGLPFAQEKTREVGGNVVETVRAFHKFCWPGSA